MQSERKSQAKEEGQAESKEHTESKGAQPNEEFLEEPSKVQDGKQCGQGY